MINHTHRRAEQSLQLITFLFFYSQKFASLTLCAATWGPSIQAETTLARVVRKRSNKISKSSKVICTSVVSHIHLHSFGKIGQQRWRSILPRGAAKNGLRDPGITLLWQTFEARKGSRLFEHLIGTRADESKQHSLQRGRQRARNSSHFPPWWEKNGLHHPAGFPAVIKTTPSWPRWVAIKTGRWERDSDRQRRTLPASAPDSSLTQTLCNSLSSTNDVFLNQIVIYPTLHTQSVFV